MKAFDFQDERKRIYNYINQTQTSLPEEFIQEIETCLVENTGEFDLNTVINFNEML